MTKSLRFIAVVTMVVLAAAPLTASAQSRDGARALSDRLFDVVATATLLPRALVLATWTAKEPRPWLLRLIEVRLRPEMGGIVSLELSRSGTHAVVVTQEGWAALLDLSEKGSVLVPVARINLRAATPAPIAERSFARTHRLPGERYPVVDSGRGFVLDDRLQVIAVSDNVSAVGIDSGK
jgi:hypothetical protein